MSDNNNNNKEEEKQQKEDEEEDLKKFLQTYHAVSALSPSFAHLHTIGEEDTVREAFDRLISHHILALPVIRVNSDDPVEMVSMEDIIAFYLMHTPLSDFSTSHFEEFEVKFTTKLRNLFDDPLHDVNKTPVKRSEER